MRYATLLLFSFFLAVSVRAQCSVVVTDPEPDLSVGPFSASWVPVDLNADSTDDLVFMTYSALDNSYNYQWGITHNAFVTQLAIVEDGAPLSAGATIDATSSYGTAMPFLLICEEPGHGATCWTYTTPTGPWASVASGYFGVRFGVNGQTHYGWVEYAVDYPSTPPGPFMLPTSSRITRYAYNTCPDQGVIAGTALPVELASFDAVADGASVRLQWQTLSETTNAGFSVEHSALNAASETISAWSEVGFVDGAGTTSEPGSYRYTVEDLDPGRHAFRLKQVDYDGAFEYSPVVEASVEVPGTHRFVISGPNPFSVRTQLSLAVEREQRVEASLYDVQGRQVRSLVSEVVPAGESVRVDVDASGLPEGVYFARVIGEMFTESRQLVVIK